MLVFLWTLKQYFSWFCVPHQLLLHFSSLFCSQSSEKNSQKSMSPTPHLSLSLKTTLINLFPNNSIKAAVVINTNIFHLIKFNDKFLVLLSLPIMQYNPTGYTHFSLIYFLHWLSRHCSLFFFFFFVPIRRRQRKERG